MAEAVTVLKDNAKLASRSWTILSIKELDCASGVVWLRSPDDCGDTLDWVCCACCMIQGTWDQRTAKTKDCANARYSIDSHAGPKHSPHEDVGNELDSSGQSSGAASNNSTARLGNVTRRKREDNITKSLRAWLESFDAARDDLLIAQDELADQLRKKLRSGD